MGKRMALLTSMCAKMKFLPMYLISMEYVFDEEENVNMCEGVQGMIDDAVEEEVIQNIRNLMKNMNLTAQQAVEAMGLSEEKKQIVLKKLKI